MLSKDIKIGFVGTGVMGASMASNILKGGYNLFVYNRTKDKAKNLIEQGAIWCDTVGELASKCDVIISIVGFPKDVEEVFLNKDGIIENAKNGSYLIDMTTSKPSLAKKIYKAAQAKDLYALDAPVSGGDVGAKNGTLSIMVGGDKVAFDELMPLFELMGKNIVLQGDAGAGQNTKLCNQIAIAANIMGVCEALAFAKKSGLNPETVLKSIETGGAASWQLTNYAPRIFKNDYAPGFFIKHFLKDINIAIEEADIIGLDAPALKLCKSLYDRLVELGKEDLGTQALYQLYV